MHSHLKFFGAICTFVHHVIASFETFHGSSMHIGPHKKACQHKRDSSKSSQLMMRSRRKSEDRGKTDNKLDMMCTCMDIRQCHEQNSRILLGDLD
jgi:hypothetical protein